MRRSCRTAFPGRLGSATAWEGRPTRVIALVAQSSIRDGKAVEHDGRSVGYGENAVIATGVAAHRQTVGTVALNLDVAVQAPRSAPVRLIVPVTQKLITSSPAWLMAAVIASRRLVTAGLASIVPASVLTDESRGHAAILERDESRRAGAAERVDQGVSASFAGRVPYGWSLFREPACDTMTASSPPAQTERRGDAGAVRTLVGGYTSPAALVRESGVRGQRMVLSALSTSFSYVRFHRGHECPVGRDRSGTMRLRGANGVGRISVEFEVANNDDVVRGTAPVISSRSRSGGKRSTASWTLARTQLVLPQSVAKKLGLTLTDKIKVRYADGRVAERRRTEGVSVELWVVTASLPRLSNPSGRPLWSGRLCWASPKRRCAPRPTTSPPCTITAPTSGFGAVCPQPRSARSMASRMKRSSAKRSAVCRDGMTFTSGREHRAMRNSARRQRARSRRC